MPYDQNAMAGVLGVQDVPYQLGDFQRSGPQMRRQGVAEALAGAFSAQPWGVGDTINAALMAVPGVRGGLMRSVIDRGMAGRPNMTHSFQSERLPGIDSMTYEMQRAKAKSASDLRQNLSRMSPEERAAYEAEQARQKAGASDLGDALEASIRELLGK